MTYRATASHVILNVDVRPASQSAGGVPDAQIGFGFDRIDVETAPETVEETFPAQITKLGSLSKQQSALFRMVIEKMREARPRSMENHGHLSAGSECPKLKLAHPAPLMTREKEYPLNTELEVAVPSRAMLVVPWGSGGAGGCRGSGGGSGANVGGGGIPAQ